VGWLAFIDVDEFMFTTSPETKQYDQTSDILLLPEFLKGYEQFGELMMERYVNSSPFQGTQKGV